MLLLTSHTSGKQYRLKFSEKRVSMQCINCN